MIDLGSVGGSRRLVVLLLCVAVAPGCSRRYAVNEENSFYQRGMALRQQGRYGAAAAAFEQCLRHSPESEQAHLQLAMLYEDHLGDLARAVVHYRQYLDREGDMERAQVAAGWLRRAEIRLYRELAQEYRSVATSDRAADVAAAAVEPATSAIPASPPPSRSPTASAVVSKTRFYMVRRGDSLSSIARRELGDSDAWKEIYELNRSNLSSPKKLQIGQRLLLPSRSERQ